MIPSRGMDWNTVRGTSPVPGGQSTNMRSMSFQMVSFQNCLTVPAITGPRQTTGSVSLSMSRLTDITSMPVVEEGGISPISLPVTLSLMPKALGIEGPVMSASRIAHLKSRRCMLTAIMEVTSDLPTPPFPLTTPITCFTELKSFNASMRLSGCFEAQALEQLEQS